MNFVQKWIVWLLGLNHLVQSSQSSQQSQPSLQEPHQCQCENGGCNNSPIKTDMEEFDPEEFDSEEFDSEEFDEDTTADIADSSAGGFFPDDTVVANLNFSLLDTGKVHVGCSWMDAELAPAYGELLYRVNNGDFIADIVQVLLNRSNSSMDEAMSIEVANIMMSWQSVKEICEDEPLIKPSEVFAPEEESMQNMMPSQQMPMSPPRPPNQFDDDDE